MHCVEHDSDELRVCHVNTAACGTETLHVHVNIGNRAAQARARPRAAIQVVVPNSNG